MEDKILGYCKECGEPIYASYQIGDRKIYECPTCGYPSLETDLFDTPIKNT